jgi:V-type H+-transporting ATPase subunit H
LSTQIISIISDCTTFKDIPQLTSTLLAKPNLYQPFLPLLSQSSNIEAPIPLLTSYILTNLASAALAKKSKSDSETEKALPQLFSYLSKLAKNADSGLQDIAVQEYSTLLRSKKAREIFWKLKDETVTPLVDILRAAAGVASSDGSTIMSGGASMRSVTDGGLAGGVGLQLLYHVLIVFWELSFEGELVGDGLDE